MKKIAVLGSPGSYHHEAAKQHFYKDFPSFVHYQNPEFLLQAIAENEQIDAGLLAVENSIAGDIEQHYLALKDLGLFIAAEVFLKVEHHLLGLHNSSIHDLEEIWSHPAAFKQCSSFFRLVLPSVKLVHMTDTASAAQILQKSRDPRVGVIAGRMAAKKYQLTIIKKDISDKAQNFTRFLVLERSCTELSEHHNKASVCFQLSDEVGALSNVLNCIKSAEINLSKLFSYPLPKSDKVSYFMADLEFDSPEQLYQLGEVLRDLTSFYQVLGTYSKVDLKKIHEFNNN